MSAKPFNWEILLIYFLLLIPWPHTQIVKMVCSRDNSRLVRKIVRSKWTPILDKHHVKLPLECPLHPLRDLYSPRQDAKKRDRPTQWTCRLCGKSFYQEKFLDLHFETRHNPIINQGEDAVCVADFCDIMRCEVFKTEESMSLKFGDQHIVTDIEVWGDSLGQNSALTQANAAYLSLLPLRTSSVGATRAAKIQSRQELFIESNKASFTYSDTSPKATTSENVKETQSKNKDDLLAVVDGSHTEQSKNNPIKQQSASNSKSDENKLGTTEIENTTAGIGESGEKNENRNSTNSQKIRANCKAEELSKLRTKCEFLVRSCIGSLLLSMTDQSFKEMEEEMNKAVCWYLTCDRYWEDGPLEPRAFPWGLILILVFILSTGICFCYYIIWILFDSEETTITNTGINNQPMYMPQQQQQQPHHYYQTYEYHGGPYLPPSAEGPAISQYQYYQQQQQQQQLQPAPQSQTADIYHEPQRYEYRNSPRRYIGDQRQPPLTTQTSAAGTGMSTMAQTTLMSASGVAQGQTPLHHHLHHLSGGQAAYTQDTLDRRDYTSRPIATTVVSSSSSSGIGPSSSATNIAGTIASNVGKQHYNTHPRPLASQHRHVGASQQSLRGSSSTHEIIQNEVGQNEHYIYVTYPPDLKKRFFEKYE